MAGTSDGKVMLLDPETFEIIDTFFLGSKFSAVFSTLQVDDGKLAVFSSRNRLYVFR